MRFFSGFSLKGEAALFDEIVAPYSDNPYVVAGFSYGAMKAVEYVYASKKRVDRVILLSPSFFRGQSDAFKKAQIRYYKKDAEKYLDRFLENAAFPASKTLLQPYAVNAAPEELEALLRYEWPESKLEAIARRGTLIETYLGKEDRIIDAEAAHAFFRNFGESYLFKPYGHILHEGDESGENQSRSRYGE